MELAVAHTFWLMHNAEGMLLLRSYLKCVASTSFHHGAEPAARAAVAAGRQGKFWEMHDLLYDKQDPNRPEESAVAFYVAR